MYFGISGWGTGIPRLLREMKEYGLQEPEFIDMEIALRINLYRSASDAVMNFKVPESAEKVPKKCRENAEKVPYTTSMMRRQEQIVEYIVANSEITSAEVEVLLDVKQRRARAILHDMVKDGLLAKIGTIEEHNVSLFLRKNRLFY